MRIVKKDRARFLPFERPDIKATLRRRPLLQGRMPTTALLRQVLRAETRRFSPVSRMQRNRVGNL